MEDSSKIKQVDLESLEADLEKRCTTGIRLNVAFSISSRLSGCHGEQTTSRVSHAAAQKLFTRCHVAPARWRLFLGALSTNSKGRLALRKQFFLTVFRNMLNEVLLQVLPFTLSPISSQLSVESNLLEPLQWEAHEWVAHEWVADQWVKQLLALNADVHQQRYQLPRIEK